MSAPAINPAASAAPGANALAGANVGAQTGQAHGALAGFEAMLATLFAAETQGATPGAGGTATSPAQAAWKTIPGAKTPPNGDDAKTKAAGDGKTTDPDTATATAATTPDGVLAVLVVPTPPIAMQAGPLVEAAVDGAAKPALAGAADKATGQAAPAQSAAATLAQATAGSAVAGVASNTAQIATAANAANANATAAAAADGAATNAAANAKVEAGLAPKADTAQVATTPTAPQTPPVAAQVAAPPPAVAAVTAAAPVVAQLAPPPVAAATDPKAAETVAPVGAKDAGTNGGAKVQAPKGGVRVDAAKSAAAPSQTAALTAKAADALQPIAGGDAKGGLEDEKSDAPLLDAKTDATDLPQAPADPATASTTTPAALIQAAAVAVRGAPQTVANLAAQIVKKLDGRSTQFDIQLDPAGLGKVDVRVAIGADGRMSAAMSFDTPQAAAELKSRAGELQQAMEQAGFDVSGGMSFDVASDQGQGGQAQNQQPEAGAAFRGRAFQAALDTTADAAPPPQLTLRRTALAGVDIRI
jgi:flagellar hook-length control protein FliK